MTETCSAAECFFEGKTYLGEVVIKLLLANTRNSGDVEGGHVGRGK